MPLYFAYGANMDADAMTRRCPRSKPLGVARLARRRFAIMPNGWGNVVADPRGVVHGVLWDLALADVPALDAFENVATGLYAKVVQPVLKQGGGSARALVYIGQGEGGTPRAEYIGSIITVARAWNLPAAYVRQLEALAPRAAGGAAPEPIAQVAPRVRPRFATPFDWK